MMRTLVLVGLVLTVAACSGDFERMRDQEKYKLYAQSSVFGDGNAMQAPPAGAVPIEVEQPPQRIDVALVQLGQDRFNVYCAACHGVLGDGDTPVAAHMPLRRPPSLHDPAIVAFTPERLYAIVTQGYGFMPSYAPQLSVRERWAVVAYVRALQRSQASTLTALPADVQQEARGALGGRR
jgi:mono/diheme cytochrome c family protein